MIEFKKGNIFESEAEYLVCPINLMGVFHNEIGKQFKERFPQMAEVYAEYCVYRAARIGHILNVYNCPDKDRTVKKNIICIPVRGLCCIPSSLEYIEKGLKAFAEKHNNNVRKRVAFPFLSDDGLSDDDVKKLMIDCLEGLNMDIEVYIS